MIVNEEAVKKILEEVKPAKLVAATKYVDVKEIEKLEKLVFPWVRSDWGDFSDLHNFVIEKKNIGLSSRVQYNDRHDIAYLKIFQNVENAFDFVLENNHAFLEGAVSRKKQVVPQLTESFNA